MIALTRIKRRYLTLSISLNPFFCAFKVAFGEYAGMVGMLDIFQGLGQRLLADGYATPFLSAPLAYMAPTLADNEAAMKNLGNRIATEGLPAGVGLLVFTFTGRGNVGRGARKIINHLPVQEVNENHL